MSVSDYEIWDAHVHFFSFNFFKTLIKMKGIKAVSEEFIRLRDELQIEIPPISPVQLARRWIEEMDKFGISKMVLLGSIPNDEASISTAVTAFPERFVGFFMIDPFADEVNYIVKNAFENLKMKGILLFPSMFHFHIYDDILEEVYKTVQGYGGVIFAHFGILKIPIREKLGIPCNFDGTYSNPTDLHRVAIRYPDINFVIPHFGAGYLREVLFLGAQCKNIYIDTSSSNNWLKLLPCELDLKTVFAKTIDVFGTERIIFGSDSGIFPRGYRIDILEQQFEILEELGLSRDEMQNILAGNLKRILKEETPPAEPTVN
jgi:hypothetical protein